MEVMLYHWSIKKWVLLPIDEDLEQIDLYDYCKECKL